MSISANAPLPEIKSIFYGSSMGGKQEVHHIYLFEQGGVYAAE
jgi:hypothetical protein